MQSSVAKSVEVLNLEKVVKDLEKRISGVQSSLDESKSAIYGPFCKKHKIDIADVIAGSSANNLQRVFEKIAA